MKSVTNSAMKPRHLAVLLLFVLPAVGQHLVPQPVFDAIANEYSGEAAQENDRQIVQYHRIQGSPMMAEVAEKVVLAKLRAWGIEASIEQFPSDGKTFYQTHLSPMGWDMRAGELWVESVGGVADFVPVRLCRYSDVPMCVSTYSKGGDWHEKRIPRPHVQSSANWRTIELETQEIRSLNRCYRTNHLSNYGGK